jgi:hypothetical protein
MRIIRNANKASSRKSLAENPMKLLGGRLD